MSLATNIRKLNRLGVVYIHKGVKYFINKYNKVGCCAVGDAFTHCEILEGTEFIPANAFYEHSGLESVVIPSTAVVINPQAFKGCKNLKDVTVKAHIQILGSEAFSCCIELQEIELVGDDLYIYPRAFSGCSKLKSVKLMGNSCTLHGGVFQDTALEHIELPEHTWLISNNLFEGTHFTELTLPTAVKYINNEAFKDSSIHKLYLSPSIVDLDDRALAYTDNLREVHIHKKTRTEVLSGILMTLNDTPDKIIVVHRWQHYIYLVLCKIKNKYKNPIKIKPLWEGRGML